VLYSTLRDDLKNFDNKYRSDSIKLVAGIDEAGRGPLAGPVVAAAVIFKEDFFLEEVNDSKKLTAKKRDELYTIITKSCLSYGIGIIDQSKIDEINILQATLNAMKLAAEQLNPQPDIILIDGNKTFDYNVPTKTIIKGDSKSLAIASASIIAKVTRDKIMEDIAKKHPNYNWHKNKGYGTREHIDAIKKYGATKIHRKSFLGKILSEEQLKMVFV
jgi:ribonuclease HII